MLVWYSIGKNREKKCPARIVGTVNNNKLVPVLLGIVNSIGFCPALFLILTKGAAQGTIINSYLDFLAFFIGSSLWFIPVPFAGRIRKKEALETIGMLATGFSRYNIYDKRINKFNRRNYLWIINLTGKVLEKAQGCRFYTLFRCSC